MTWVSRICFSILLVLPGWPLSRVAVTGAVELIDSADSTRKNGDRSGVVVWLEPLSDTPSPVTDQPRTATILQKKKRFIPHVLAIQVGTAVDFPNDDPIFHNAFSNFDGQIFDIGLYPPGTSRRVSFHRPGIVRVFCNIHPMMSAVIAVVPTPWFATSAADGAFEIALIQGPISGFVLSRHGNSVRRMIRKSGDNRFSRTFITRPSITSCQTHNCHFSLF